MNSHTILLKPKREKPVIQRHPWVYSGAIEQIPKEIENGNVVDIADRQGNWLARGLLNRDSQIQIRILTWNEEEEVDHLFWQRRIEQAVRMRKALFPTSTATAAYRLIHGESDFLPGLTVDQYGEYLAIQIGSLGIEQRKVELAQWLMEATGCRGVVDRSDGVHRRKEKMPPLGDPLIAGERPPDLITIEEAGKRFQVDLFNGQKSGFYLDQRENRQRVATYCQGKRVLNAFSYTGAFAVHALAAGAIHATNVDTSYGALSQGEKHIQENGFDSLRQSEHIAGDIFEIMRDWRGYDHTDGYVDDQTVNEEPENDSDYSDTFDLIILDPPKFAHSAGQLNRALRGYKDINMLALQLLPPGGILATFSCSGLVTADLFQKVLFGAAIDAKRDLQILERLGQPADHPTAITFPEGNYLKGLVCRVV
ncbi:MAG: class I SAM-dependent rRNA methyltransferase [Chloroflexota bacterium]